MTARSFPSLPWMRELQRRKWDRPLLPAWQTGIQDTISWFVAGAHQWLLIPLKAGWTGIGMTPPARAHTHPAALSPSLYAAHYKHPFCYQHQILIPAPELKNWKEVKATHHFIIDFMKMNLADLFHHILVLESYKAESCEEGEDGREKTGEERKGGKSSWLKWTNTDAVKWTGKKQQISVDCYYRMEKA